MFNVTMLTGLGFDKRNDDFYQKTIYRNGHALIIVVELDDDGWIGIAFNLDLDFDKRWAECEERYDNGVVPDFAVWLEDAEQDFIDIFERDKPESRY